ncbi:hypothetical protein ACLQ2R_03380 [Streptosporangium sp. DT93]|uniref:hypothetical protein n=1 Tax=Streptosporangium sp. DT93 TaxID=3393428 RepID=UPI003CF8AD2A
MPDIPVYYRLIDPAGQEILVQLKDEVPAYRIYTSEQGAARIGGDVISAWTLYRLAREDRVPCTRNGRKVGWTDEQLAGAVAYMQSRGAQKTAKPTNKRTSSSPQEARPRGRAEIAPLVSRPARRYSTATP